MPNDAIDGSGLAARLTKLEAEVRRQSAETDQTAMIQMLLRDNAKRREAEERLSLAQEWIQLAQEVGRAAAYTFDFATGELSWSASTYALYGWPATRRASIENWLEAIHPDDRASVESVATAAISHGEPVKQEFRILRADGDIRWLQDRGQVLLNEKGEPLRLVGLNIDITDLKLAEQRLDYIVGEVGHRFKNLLTLVQAMVEQSAKNNAADPSTMRDDLIARIGALARSKDILIRHQLVEVPIQELVADQVYSVVGAGNSAITIVGEDLHLLPSAAQPIGMVLHELATNACKHGALIGENGVLTVEWEGDDRQFALRWKETWPEQDDAGTNRIGFGSRITKTLVERAVGGTTTRSLTRTGFHWSLTAPSDKVVVPAQSSAISL